MPKLASQPNYMYIKSGSKLTLKRQTATTFS